MARGPGNRYKDMGVFERALEGLLVGGEEKNPDPVRKSQPPAEPEPNPVVDREGETKDVLETEPAEVDAYRKQPVEQANHIERSRKRLPSWLTWSLLGIVALVVILVITLSQRGGSEPASNAETQSISSEETSTTLA